jgi:hypothetical protein
LKSVRFAEPISTYRPITGDYRLFIDGYQQLQHLQTPVQTQIDLQKPIRICKGLQSSVKRIEAIQVFHPRPERIEDSFTGNYRMSRIVDSLSLCSNPYSGQIRPFRVSTAYKTKANKVQPVDSSETDGSKPGGRLDWFEKSKLDDVLCQDSGQYSDWITPKFSDIPKSSIEHKFSLGSKVPIEGYCLPARLFWKVGH